MFESYCMTASPPRASLTRRSLCVDAFKAHVNVGFFHGAELAIQRAWEGTGKYMRHVKLLPDRDIDAAAMTDLIESAYADMKQRLEAE